MEITFLKQSRKNHRNGESRGDIFADSNGWMDAHVFQYTTLMHDLKALRPLQQWAHDVVQFLHAGRLLRRLAVCHTVCDMSASFIPQVVVDHKWPQKTNTGHICKAIDLKHDMSCTSHHKCRKGGLTHQCTCEVSMSRPRFGSFVKCPFHHVESCSQLSN